MPSYTVKTDRSGDRVVEFPCPHCAAELRSPLAEAGQRFACPTCAAQIETPGKVEWWEHQEQRSTMRKMAEQAKSTDQINAPPPSNAQPLEYFGAAPPTKVEPIANVSHAEHVTPDYKEILRAAFVIQILSGMLYVLGAIIFVMSLIAIGSTITSIGPRYMFASAGLIFMFYGLALLAGGAVLHLLSGVARAFRDMAINSLRKK